MNKNKLAYFFLAVAVFLATIVVFLAAVFLAVFLATFLGAIGAFTTFLGAAGAFGAGAAAFLAHPENAKVDKTKNIPTINTVSFFKINHLL